MRAVWQFQIAGLVVAIGFLAGCSRQPAEAGAQTTGAAPIRRAAVARAFVIGIPETIRTYVEPPPPKPTAVYGSLEAVRDTVGEMIYRTIARGDTAIHVTRESVSFTYHYAPATVQGWMYHIVVTDTSSCPNEAIGDLLAKAGWVPEYGYSADGPDGSDMGYVTEKYLCAIEAQWDGGDDTDTTVVPAPGCEIRVTCVPRRADDVWSQSLIPPAK